MLFFGKLVRAPDDDILRRVTFTPGGVTPIADKFIRVIGRPKNEWTKMLKKQALAMCGSSEAILDMASNAVRWRAKVAEYIAN